MAPSAPATSLYSEEIDQRAQDPNEVDAAATAALSFIRFIWDPEDVTDLHLDATVGFLERVSTGDTIVGANLDDFAVVRTAIAAGLLSDTLPVEDLRIASDVLAQAMVFMRQTAGA